MPHPKELIYLRFREVLQSEVSESSVSQLLGVVTNRSGRHNDPRSRGFSGTAQNCAGRFMPTHRVEDLVQSFKYDKSLASSKPVVGFALAEVPHAAFAAL